MHIDACSAQRTHTAAGFTITERSANTPELATKSSDPDKRSNGYLDSEIAAAAISFLGRPGDEFVPSELVDPIIVECPKRGSVVSRSRSLRTADTLASERIRIDKLIGGFNPICILLVVVYPALERQEVKRLMWFSQENNAPSVHKRLTKTAVGITGCVS